MTRPKSPLPKRAPLPRHGAAPPRPAEPAPELRVPGLGETELLALAARLGDHLAVLSDADFRRVGEALRAEAARRQGREPPAPLFPRGSR